MSRPVRVPKRASDDLAIAGLEDMLPHGLGGAEDQQITAETDNYPERIAKYVPARDLHGGGRPDLAAHPAAPAQGVESEPAAAQRATAPRPDRADTGLTRPTSGL